MTSRKPGDVPSLLRALARTGCLSHAVEESPGITIERARSLLEWAADTIARSGLHPPPVQVCFGAKGEKAPECLRVFTDGAARGNPGPAAAGAVLLDPQGKEVERFGRYLGKTTNNVAEYEGVIMALARAAELGARRVELFTDSELLVRQLSGRYKVRAAHLQPLFRRTVELLGSFDEAKVRHVPRSENVEADAMANKAIDDGIST